MSLDDHAQAIIRAALDRARPDDAVRRALEGAEFSRGRLVLLAVGKAAWTMANAALESLAERGIPLAGGLVITKHGHSRGPLPPLAIREAGHPVPDAASFAATAEAVALARSLQEGDTLLFLLSGGGSALFEQPLIEPEELFSITDRLLASGADIVAINTVRKRLSAVKGGRFAALCAPARVFSVVLSDVLGDPLDMIASGPCAVDSSTAEQALAVVEHVRLPLSDKALALLRQETPKELLNVESHVVGSVRLLCEAAADTAATLGYAPHVLTTTLNCNAADAGRFLAALAREQSGRGRRLALIAGGETTVRLQGTGKGGRNQELALAAALELAGLPGVLLFSLGSDGTDGPTDAAGGLVTGDTAARIAAAGISPAAALRQNDSYHALAAADALLLTGPTGTNLNDLTVLLIDG